MTNSQNVNSSSVEDLNAAIQNYNPFNKPAVVTDQDVWGKGFPDLPTHNAHASDAVFEAINEVRNGLYPVTSIAFNAAIGVGKSHIISRIRHRLQDQGGALFIYMRKYGDLSLIKYQFQQVLADSLRQVGNQGVMQWQELAASMINQTSKTKRSASEIIKILPDNLAKKPRLIDSFTREVLKHKPHISDPDVVKAILWTLSVDHVSYATKWLSGKDIADDIAKELGLPNSNKDIKYREAEALDTAMQVISLISDYSPLIICFDELEGVEVNEAGYKKVQVVSHLIKEVFDNLSQSSLSQGVVILTMLLPGMWENDLTKGHTSGSGVKDRVSAKYKEPIDLKHLDSDSAVDITALWLNSFYKERNLSPIHLVYPFDESKLRELGKQKPSGREILTWCRENFIVNTPPPDPDELVENAFKKELCENRGDYLDDSDLIAKSLCFGIERLTGQCIEGVTIQEVSSQIKPKGKNAGSIQIKVIGKENDQEVKLGVAVVQHSHGLSVGTRLQRLTDYKTFDLTRGCLVRSKDRKIKKYWEADKLIKYLVDDLGGEWTDLKEEDIKPLVAILAVYEGKETYSLTENQVFHYISKTKLASDNALIHEILSKPSGFIPDSEGEENINEEEVDLLKTSDDDSVGDLLE